ncbi:Uncharacterised protein [Vibrio cholerae]|nr:Uncharacterised protein [Vibrio cholerae]
MILGGWVTLRVDNDHLVRVKQLLITFKQNLESQLIVVSQPSPSVGQGISLHF